MYLELSLSVRVHACMRTCVRTRVCMRSWLCVCGSAWVRECTYIAFGASIVLL